MRQRDCPFVSFWLAVELGVLLVVHGLEPLVAHVLILTGADPVFCVAVCTASTMGAVMRQPVMVVGLLLMCFPLKGIVCMIIAAVIAAGIPLPKPLRK